MSLICASGVNGSSQTSLFLCVLERRCSAGAFRKLLGFGWPIGVQEEREVALPLDGERLVRGEDMVPFPSRADLLEGCCGQDVDSTASELLDGHTARLPLPAPVTMCLCLTCTICRAALAPGTPGFPHTAAAELAG